MSDQPEHPCEKILASSILKLGAKEVIKVFVMQGLGSGFAERPLARMLIPDEASQSRICISLQGYDAYASYDIFCIFLSFVCAMRGLAGRCSTWTPLERILIQIRCFSFASMDVRHSLKKYLINLRTVEVSYNSSDTEVGRYSKLTETQTDFQSRSDSQPSLPFQAPSLFRSM